MKEINNWLSFLFRFDHWNIRSEDEHCFVECECGEELSAMGDNITWCEKCGLGYSTEFKCYRHPKWLKGGDA